MANYFSEISLFVVVVFNRSSVALLLVPQLLLVYQQFTENSAAFVLLIGLELRKRFVLLSLYTLCYTPV